MLCFLIFLTLPLPHPGDPPPAKQSSNEKLISKLQGRFPELSRSDGVRYINMLRKQNQVRRQSILFFL